MAARTRWFVDTAVWAKWSPRPERFKGAPNNPESLAENILWVPHPERAATIVGNLARNETDITGVKSPNRTIEALQYCRSINGRGTASVGGGGNVQRPW